MLVAVRVSDGVGKAIYQFPLLLRVLLLVEKVDLVILTLSPQVLCLLVARLTFILVY